MSSRVFHCSCQKCGAQFDYNGSYEKFKHYMDAKTYTCDGGHFEPRSPRCFVKVVNASGPAPVQDWVPTIGRIYLDIFDQEATRINRMQLEHIGSGIYIDRRTGKKYDYEEDVKGRRHYFEVAFRLE